MIKYLLIASSALVMASGAQAQASASPFAGPYVGFQVGYAELEDVHDDLDYWYDNFKNFKQNDDNLVGGVRVGYDHVFGPGVLVGVVGEFSLTDLDTVGPARPDYNTYEIGAKVRNLGSIRGKLGFASGKLAVYGTAGLGYANIKHHMMDIDGSSEGYDEKGDRTGFVFGVGGAIAVNDRSAFGLDLSQYNFGSRTHEVIDPFDGPTDYFFRQKDRIRTAMITYSYGF